MTVCQEVPQLHSCRCSTSSRAAFDNAGAASVTAAAVRVLCGQQGACPASSCARHARLTLPHAAAPLRRSYTVLSQAVPGESDPVANEGVLRVRTATCVFLS